MNALSTLANTINSENTSQNNNQSSALSKLATSTPTSNGSALSQLASSKPTLAKQITPTNQTIPQAPFLTQNSITKPMIEYGAQVQQGFSDFLHNPLKTLYEAGKTAIQTPVNAVKNLVEKAAQTETAFTSKDRPLAEKIAKPLELFGASANVVFSPISAVFQAADKIPVLKTAADILNAPFTLTGKAGEFVADKFTDALPVSNQTKDILRPAFTEIGGVAGQIILGGKILEHLTSNPEIKPEEVKTLAEQAKMEVTKSPEVKSAIIPTLPEIKSAIPETPQAKTLEDYNLEITKSIEKFRKEAGLMASKEGAGVRYRPVENAVGGIDFMAKDFKLSRAKSDMFKQSQDLKKYASSLLYEYDGNFKKLVDARDKLLENNINTSIDEIDISKIFDTISQEEAQLNENIKQLGKIKEIANIKGQSPQEIGAITIPETQKTGVTLTSGINPGIDKFIEQDIKPTTQGLAGGLAKTWDLFKKTFAPATRGEEALKTASIMRESLGKMARSKELVYSALNNSRKIFDAYTKDQSIDFINKLETGQKIAGAEQFTATMREALDSRWKKIQDIKGTDAYIKDYFPHIWKDPVKAEGLLGKFFGKRPLEGTKSYLKQRTIPTVADGIKLGLEPVSYNPVDLVAARVADMDRFLMANDVWRQFKAEGLNKFVKAGEKAPDGWQKINDKIATVFYRPSSKEFFDEQIMNNLNKVADSFGIKHERVISGRGLGGNRAGVSFTGENLIKTKIASPEDVLLHEIGHQLDERFNIQSKFVNNPDFKVELRKLADLRYEGKDTSNYFKSYVRKGEEKVATMFQAYLHAPAKFKEVAPNTFKAFETFLKSDERLKHITEIKPSLVLGSNVIQQHILAKSGDWYMPEKAATIVNNYLSPGLSNNPIYQAFRMVGNDLNQVQLGMSGFHALFTSGDVIVSKGALELQKGNILKTLISPLNPKIIWDNLTKGNKLLTDYYKQNPEMPEMVNSLEKAGGRVRMDSFYLNNSVDNFLKALREGNYLGAGIRAPGALLEETAKPIMQELVPRQKLGVFADSATYILDQAKKEGWSEYKTTLRLQEMWDSVDNRMGQLVYDNLFWNKVLKDLGMASTRSLGWNLGTIRELGGGIKDIAKIPFQLLTEKGRANIRITPKMAYTMTLPYTVGVWGAIVYYLYNGTAPKNLLDFYYPKTGKQKPDGTEERISLPSYMKDVFAYKTQPLQTISNKLHPEISAMIAMFQNKDYYGTEIRNSNDPLVKQIGDTLLYQAKQFVPFTIQNLIQRQKAGGSWGSYLQSFAGITPAPGYITRSPLQTEIYDIYDKRFGGGIKTQESADQSKQKSEIRTLYLLGKTDEANQKLKEATLSGLIKNPSQFIQEADIPNDIKLFKRLPSQDQEALIKKMELFQLNRYAWYVSNSVKGHFSSLSDNTKNFVDMVKRREIIEPKWKRGQIIP